jgi:hypothetical protein
MSDFKLVRADTVSFLLGEEGDFKRVPGEGPFWWRNVLRNGVVGYHEADSEKIDKLTAENERLRAGVLAVNKNAESHERDMYLAQHEVERLQARVAELESFINQAPVETGVCMCGEEMYRHSSQPNHTPMDSWDYERDLILRNDADKVGGDL